MIGLARLELLIPWSTSLKDKRSIVHRIVQRGRARFNASIAEVDALDLHQRAVIGVAVVSNSTQHARSMLDGIVATMLAGADAELLSRDIVVQQVGDHDFTGI
ncbi:MAG: DUF503 domain-containing protein [Sandaracinaceae bacterium]|nr:DUF503 domain-containing protein [Sandaracinaceae bacterium]MDW8246876.1 DUF503 domain-containing protein [Sandaracinaceae bacterium]